MWPSPPFPESERYGCYYNPYNDIYLSFYDDEKNNDYQYVVFTKMTSGLSFSQANAKSFLQFLQTILK